MRLPVNHVLPLAALIVLSGCGGAGSDRPAPIPVRPVSGPAADYPVVVGDPFTIGDTTWTPTDQLNYDAVGYATVSSDAVTGITAAHKTLPLPSYAEVTSLDTGRTILLRVERRGPMVNNTLIELSQGAADQLGIAPGSRVAVRVRRTNPPEEERALLRRGERAPERMETPQALLKVLSRKLTDQAPLLPLPSTPPAMPKAEAAAPATPKPAAAPPAIKQPAPETKQQAKPATAQGTMIVQVAAFSVEQNAKKVAAELGGQVEKPGKFWLVRLGPFTNRAQAAPALEKARTAGYRDARIQHAD
jgi:rare lipoprotein A